MAALTGRLKRRAKRVRFPAESKAEMALPITQTINTPVIGPGNAEQPLSEDAAATAHGDAPQPPGLYLKADSPTLPGQVGDRPDITAMQPIRSAPGRGRSRSSGGP